MTNTRRLFGTDGIRGKANTEPMTAGSRCAWARRPACCSPAATHRHRVVIGKDTRLSGYMIEPALTAGFIGAGMDVTLLGPLPTPAVAMLTRSLRADLGVMISASHNPYEDNGIKLFGPDGTKLSDEMEMEIEALMDSAFADRLPNSHLLGRAARLDDAAGRYIEAAKASFPRGLRLDGLRIVIDCANGAAYKVAPTVLWELGATVIPVGVVAGWFQHQQGLRLDGAGVPVRQGAGAWRAPGHRAGWGRRPGDHRRRERRGGRRRPDPGADRAELAPGRARCAAAASWRR